MREEEFGTTSFRIGSVRLTVDRNRHQALRRLKGQALTTANVLSDNLDDLSEFLGAEYQEKINSILDGLNGMGLPEKYHDVVRLAREAHHLYSTLLDAVGEREGFDREP